MLGTNYLDTLRAGDITQDEFQEALQHISDVCEYARSWNLRLMLAEATDPEVCHMCGCPFPAFHIAFREQTIEDGCRFICFECLEQEYLGAEPERFAPAGADHFRDKGTSC